MHLIALSYYQLRIEAETLEEGGTLKALMKKIKKRTIAAEKKGEYVHFTNGNKTFSVRIGRPNADREDIDQMIPKIPKGISSVSPVSNAIIITF